LFNSKVSRNLLNILHRTDTTGTQNCFESTPKQEEMIHCQTHKKSALLTHNEANRNDQSYS